MTHIANDWTPPTVKDLTALEATFRATSWAHDRFAERCELPSREAREARAKYYEERAAGFARDAAERPSMLELAGLNALAARIMRAEL